jgi:polyhydroxyalkanoate synthesis regulator phasin
MDAAERFTAAARSFLDGAANAPAAGEAARVFSDFLREQFTEFRLPWSSGIGAGAGHGAPPSMGDSPAFGATREHQQRWQRMAEASRRIDDAQRRLQRLWSDALREAAAAFAARLVSPHPSGVSAEALRKLYDTWIDCAEEAYARVAHDEAFCNALAEYVNASSQWRRELQASFEHMTKLLDLPTRSEINTLTQRLKSVEELLRAAQNKRKPQVAANRTRPARRKAKQ